MAGLVVLLVVAVTELCESPVSDAAMTQCLVEPHKSLPPRDLLHLFALSLPGLDHFKLPIFNFIVFLLNQICPAAIILFF